MAGKNCTTDNVLRELSRSGAYSDLTITCGDSEFHVHKNVVCMQSGFFKKACEEGRWEEGHTDVIKLQSSDDPLEGDDPYVVGLMISCLYEIDYEPKPTTKPSRLTKPKQNTAVESGAERTERTFSTMQSEIISSSRHDEHAKRRRVDAYQAPTRESFLPVHAQLFALASKYDIPGLQLVSLAKFRIAARENWQKDDFIGSIAIAFNTAPDKNGLLNFIKETIIAKSEQLNSDPEFGVAIGDIDGLALDLFQRKCRSNEVPQRYCSNCGSYFQSQCLLTGCPPSNNSKARHICDKQFCGDCLKSRETFDRRQNPNIVRQ